MSIENAIKNLRRSIENLTNVIIESNKEKIQMRVSEPTPINVETKLKREIIGYEEEVKKKVEIKNPSKPLEYQEDNQKNEAKVKVTNDIVKQLAKEKMASGVDRSKIKAIITSLAGQDASIADLDESNIEECYNRINELQPE